MSGLIRKMKRQQQKTKGTLVYKKVVARKMGVTITELNRIMKEKELERSKNYE